MATRFDNITTVLNNLAAQMADLSASNQTTVSAAGRVYQKAEYLTKLREEYKEWQLLLLQSQDAFEVRTVATT